MPLRLDLGGLIGSEIDLVSGDDEAALARLGRLHRISQFDRRHARVARGDRALEIGLRPLAQPDIHGDDRHEGYEPDQQEGGGRADDVAPGHGHRALLPYSGSPRHTGMVRFGPRFGGPEQ